MENEGQNLEQPVTKPPVERITPKLKQAVNMSSVDSITSLEQLANLPSVERITPADIRPVIPQEDGSVFVLQRNAKDKDNRKLPVESPLFGALDEGEAEATQAQSKPMRRREIRIGNREIIERMGWQMFSSGSPSKCGIIFLVKESLISAEIRIFVSTTSSILFFKESLR